MSNVTSSGIAVDASPAEASANSEEDSVRTPNGERPKEDQPKDDQLS